MCLVCVEYQAGRMTAKEVDRALTEMVDFYSSDEDIIHVQEVLENLKKKD